ncbi:hypothetical protein [Leptospira noguchii]|uniref:hypothetical protein n=1 Tax=Leptospira noguchii TaxID=28182 RepID=UPI0007739FEA|nr:hypothetical protein [Leptospira noguchii]UOG58988.1 hypothetical protein MAL07_09045 [Leptospira noguchii]
MRAKKTDWNIVEGFRKPIEIACNLEIQADEVENLTKGFVPKDMEDKWFIYFEEKTLFCYRSWTGHCIYEVSFKDVGKTLQSQSFRVERDQSRYRNMSESQDIEILKFLIYRVLLKKFEKITFSEKDPIALWSTFGQALNKDSTK